MILFPHGKCVHTNEDARRMMPHGKERADGIRRHLMPAGLGVRGDTFLAKAALVVMIAVLALTMTACFPTGEQTGAEPAGFLMGVWHGWIAPISLIMGFVDGETRIYETYNSGIWYDLGFYVSIIAGFGGLALRRRRKK